MSAIKTTGIKHQIKDITAALPQAKAGQLVQIVATIDAMENRGAADALLAPLRPRLNAMGITRPLTLCRISFEPLDCLIVAPPDWQRGQPLVPRSALMPLFDIMRAGNPEFSKAEAMLETAAAGGDARRALTSLLWQRGGEALAGSEAPPNWREASGLAVGDFVCLRDIISAVLAQADQLRTLDPHADEAWITQQLREILQVAAGRGGMAWQAVVTLLCAGRHFVAIAMRLATDLATTPELAKALDPAFACARELLRKKLNGAPAAGRLTSSALAEMAGTLVDIEHSAGLRSERRRESELLRREADRICGQSMERIIADDLLPRLQAGAGQTGAGETSKEASKAAEMAARELRSFGLISQALAGSDRHQARLRPVIQTLVDPANGRTPVERARLLEILGQIDLAQDVLKTA
jgi:hypothetical protein